MYKIYEHPFDTNTLEDNVVIIDVLRAATVASIVCMKKPLVYYMSSDEDKIKELYNENPLSITIGKPEKNKLFTYAYVNSPTRIWDGDFTNKVVLHRSRACGGMLDQLQNKNVLIAGFCNVSAVSQYIVDSNLNWDIVCCGFNAEEPNDEDKLCADILTKYVTNNQNHIYKKLEKSKSVTFFEKNQPEYPKEDIKICLTLDLVSFVMKGHNNIISVI
tara:strand:- start:166 stop:816 length:651 start_codon:yes stop_codon:yes gene_type:complete